MACPYFFPVRPRDALAGRQNAMLPLGDLWSGECRAEPDRPCEAAETDLRPLCNLGYARGACVRFPAAPELPDAVRFSVAADEGTLLRLYYVVERNHHPFAHGPLEYATDRGAFNSPPESGNLNRQALAYLESYLRRKNEAAQS